jgi:hypothetical protein
LGYNSNWSMYSGTWTHCKSYVTKHIANHV